MGVLWIAVVGTRHNSPAHSPPPFLSASLAQFPAGIRQVLLPGGIALRDALMPAGFIMNGTGGGIAGDGAGGGAGGGGHGGGSSRGSGGGDRAKRFDISEVKLLGVTLGEGSFGKVEKGEWRHQLVAIKTLKVPTGTMSRRQLTEMVEDMEREAELHFKLRHDNIVQLLGLAVNRGAGVNIPVGGGRAEDEIAMVMSFARGGSLHKRLGAGVPIPTAQKLKWIAEVTAGLAYLHSEGLVHADLKSLNVLLHHGDVAQLCDFGFTRSRTGIATASTVFRPTTEGRGSLLWMAPEQFMVDGRPAIEANKRTDVYSLAIVWWEILAQRLPFLEIGFSHLASQLPLALQGGTRPPLGDLPSDVPRALIELMKRCWDGDYRTRRPRDANAVAEELATILPDLSSLSVRTPAPPPAERDASRIVRGPPEEAPAASGGGGVGGRGVVGGGGGGGPAVPWALPPGTMVRPGPDAAAGATPAGEGTMGIVVDVGSRKGRLLVSWMQAEEREYMWLHEVKEQIVPLDGSAEAPLPPRTLVKPGGDWDATASGGTPAPLSGVVTRRGTRPNWYFVRWLTPQREYLHAPGAEEVVACDADDADAKLSDPTVVVAGGAGAAAIPVPTPPPAPAPTPAPAPVPAPAPGAAGGAGARDGTAIARISEVLRWEGGKWRFLHSEGLVHAWRVGEPEDPDFVALEIPTDSTGVVRYQQSRRVQVKLPTGMSKDARFSRCPWTEVRESAPVTLPVAAIADYLRGVFRAHASGFDPVPKTNNEGSLFMRHPDTAFLLVLRGDGSIQWRETTRGPPGTPLSDPTTSPLSPTPTPTPTPATVSSHRSTGSAPGLGSAGSAGSGGSATPSLPAGSLVHRGTDWTSGDADGGLMKLGTVVGSLTDDGTALRVRWSYNGETGVYVFSPAGGRTEVMPISLLSALPHNTVVVRGRDWTSADVDGGAGKYGTVMEACRDTPGWFTVHWESTGLAARHRFGADGKYDINAVIRTAEAARSSGRSGGGGGTSARSPASPPAPAPAPAPAPTGVPRWSAAAAGGGGGTGAMGGSPPMATGAGLGQSFFAAAPGPARPDTAGTVFSTPAASDRRFPDVDTRVRRGPAWRYGDQDGGPRSVGTVIKPVRESQMVRVKWPSGVEQSYRWGKDGAYDLERV